jgi:hypothetical protein
MENNNKFAYQKILRAAIFFTLLSGGCSMWLSSQDTLTCQQEQLFETANNTWKVGTHAIFGLLGNGAISLFQEEENEE